ncbi:hypothetical protein NA57DRAFT_76400 [Rhizodiscina lignyota]|uniref:Phosphatidylglycerol lysyltransferase C-terminal domain-containing protein n=1 Tax=Rhizodiscina lignyota TaxID=1504668 RepID=A0A9P4IFQ1_9PEZI|nr:hypothetical protein NA57DRAFT_76400 [Rhizodiscina lignyota]
MARKPKNARINGPRADAGGEETKRQLEAKCTQSTAREYLFQRVGNNMADALLYTFQNVPDPLDLARHLIVTQWSTTLSSSASMTTTMGSSGTTMGSSGTTTGSPGTTTGSSETVRPNPQTLLHFTGSHIHVSSPNYTRSSPVPKWKRGNNIFSLGDFAAMAALESLIERYGRVSHMGILDQSYSFFLSSTMDAALYFKVENKIAVVGGDPLCRPDEYPAVLEEFKRYRKKKGLGIAFLGASGQLASFAREQGWVTMHFGEECVLNPATNPVLFESAGKRIISQNKQLLDPNKGNISVEVYSPATGTNPILQKQLMDIYETWREERNRQYNGKLQAFITVYNPFALPELMIYIYTRGPDGRPNGFAALRKLGANSGFHIDPCIATHDAPRGVTDLLIFSAMALLNRAGISYLSLGYEPMPNLGEIVGMPKFVSSLSRSAYQRTFRALPVGGKKAYHDKFRPDTSLQSGLYIIFPDGVPGPRHAAAVMHVANIKIRQLIVPNRPKILRWHHGVKNVEAREEGSDKEGKVRGSEESSENESKVRGSEESIP